jgi:2-polyprenyl-3-methyl-5-hydroxy-6-metoxy-1,4-benzoquinol methylase
MITVKKFPCDLCGSHDQKFLLAKKGELTGADFSVVKCGCGFIFLNPRLDENDIRALYDEKYYHGKGFDPHVDYCAEINSGRDETKISHPEDTIVALKELVAPPASLLDFGCGLGDLIVNAAKHGYRCEGYEVSDFGRKFAEKNGVTIYNTLENIPAGNYDIVTAIEVLEHCHSPRRALEAIVRSLKPGGWFYYTTENFDGWRPNADDRRDGYITPEGHIHFFSTPVINRYFKEVGLTSVAVRRKSYLKGGRLYKLLKRMNLVDAGDAPRSWFRETIWRFGNWIGCVFNIKSWPLPLGRKEV